MGDGGGITSFRNGVVRNYRAAEGLPAGTINALAEDRAGTIWAATNQGLFRHSADRWEHDAQEHGLPSGPALSAYVNKQGDLLVGLENEIFSRPQGASRFQQFEAPADHAPIYFEGPTAIGEDPDGRPCVNDSIAGFRRLGERSSVRSDGERGRGSRLLLDRNNNLWVGTGGQGIWRVRFQPHSTNYTTQSINALSGLLSDGVTALFEDRDGNIWVGTTEGLHRFTRSKVAQITDIGLVAGVEATPDGNIWVGTVDELIRFSDPTIDSPTDRISWHSAKLRAMHADANGTLWVATSSYVARVIDRRIEPVFTLGNGLPHDIDSMTSDGRGGLWLHDLHQGFFHWTGRTVARVSFAAGLERMRVLTTYTDRDNRVWIAFFDGTVGVIDNAGGLRLYAPEDGLHAGPYRAIYEDQSGTIWLVGGDGLTRFVRGRFQTVKRGPGFPMLLNAVIDDGAQNLFLGTRSGIVTIRKDEFDSAVATGAFHYKLYDRSDGLAGLPLMNINNRRVIRAKDNRLWFVTARGLSVIDPQGLRDDQPSIPIRIESIVADEKRFPAAGPVALPPRTTRVEIDYTVLNLTSPLRTQFRYRLEGFDKDGWTPGAGGAFYTNLAPGVLVPCRRVALRRRLGRARRAREFTIRPTFYQTIWFYVAVAIGVGLALQAAWALRLRHLRHEFFARARRTGPGELRNHDTLPEPGRARVAVRRHRQRRCAGRHAARGSSVLRKQVEEHP